MTLRGLTKKPRPLSSGERDTLAALAKFGALDDGDVPSKIARDLLVERGWVGRRNGDNWLTREGGEAVIKYGLTQPQLRKRK